ncbi:hypothetical protein Bca4012_081942 [Brassica carinata]
MPPKRNETDQQLELASQNANKIASLEQDMSRMSMIEQAILTMQQQMAMQASKLEILDRLEQRFNDEEESRKRSRETGKGLLSPVDENPSVTQGGVFGGDKSQIGTSHAPLSPMKEDGLRSRASPLGDSFRGEGAWERLKALTQKMEILTFNGEDADEWVLRVEQYFEIIDFTEEEKLRDVRMCFVGESLLWYRWERDRNPFRSWAQLRRRVLAQYSEMQDTTAGERLLALHQEGSVREYNRDFAALASNSPEISESVLKMTYKKGLKQRIRAGVRMFGPDTLEALMSTARTVEEWSGYADPPYDGVPPDKSTESPRYLSQSSSYPSRKSIDAKPPKASPKLVVATCKWNQTKGNSIFKQRCLQFRLVVDEGSKSTITTNVVADNVCKPMKAEMASKEDDEDTRSTTTSTSTPRGRRSSVGPASGFSFRLEEKAGKRKEVALCLQPFFVLYFLREEEKIHAKEVEKTTMHEKSKIPTTRPISPTLGRRKSSGDATGSETGLRVTKLKDSSSSFICLEETHNKASVKGKNSREFREG